MPRRASGGANLDSAGLTRNARRAAVPIVASDVSVRGVTTHSDGRPVYYDTVCPKCGGETPAVEEKALAWGHGDDEPTRVDGTWDCPSCGEVKRRLV
jgi:hypothetical protein